MAHESILVATERASDANSYITLADAEVMVEHEMLHTTGWTGSDLLKEAALIWATRILDYSFNWKGYKSLYEQSLDWPRFNAYSRYGTLLGYDYNLKDAVVPKLVKHAVVDLAISLLQSDVTKDPDSKGLKSLQVDVIKMEFLTSDAAKAINIGIKSMLEDYGTFIDADKSGGMVRLVRG